MRTIGIQDIRDMALGGSFLAAGGGGDPYIGEVTAISAIKAHGEVQLMSVDELDDDAVVLPIAGVGAPTVLVEKGLGASEYERLYTFMERYLGKPVTAIMSAECGGVNSMLPIAAAATLGLPLVDADGMGRAFPEIQMVTFTIGGISASPMVIVDEKGNLSLIEAISNKWVEEICRAGCVACGGEVTAVLYAMNGAQVKEFGVRDTMTLCQDIGRTIRTIKECPEGQTPEEYFLDFTGAYRLFKGKISDVLRETREGFNFGHAILEGLGDYKGRSAKVTFQNENIQCIVDDKILATAPDLICMVDTETFRPIPTDALKYGKRVLCVGLPCYHLWRTQAGIDLVGPRWFGLDTDYIPVEERCAM